MVKCRLLLLVTVTKSVATRGEEMLNGKPGYVVVLGTNRFLSRSERPVRHVNRSRSTTGGERAWVHTAETARAWADRATTVIPAYYDQQADLTRLTGEPIPIATFLASA